MDIAIHMKHCLILTLIAFMTMIAALPVALAQVPVREIRVEGSQRVEPATVLSYMTIHEGDAATPDALDSSLKNLFATGLFADVKIDQQADALIVHVVENPVINQIAFEGNDRIKDEELSAEVQLKPRQVLTRTKVQADVARIYQLYRRSGRFSVTVEPKIIRLDQNRVNLIFEVTEGDVTKVESIRFVGNKRFSDDTLRSEISTRESAWYRFISSDDRYDPDRLSYDQELLRKFYLARGYADFTLVSAVAELAEDRKHFYITFTIEEGQRYKIGDVKINSALRNFNPKVLNDKVTVKTGQWYNADSTQKTVDALTDALGDLQYAFVNVQANVTRNREARKIDLVFQISESPRVFVERININGNVRTLDKVIRRKMLLSEGDPFNKSKLARSEQRIKDLDYFETAEVKAEPGSAPDKSVVNIDVAEKSTGELSVGAGFSSSDGPLADFSVRERNLLGKGQDLLLAATIAGQRTEFDASFTEPYFLNRDLSAGVDLFHMTKDLQDESSYDQKRTGGGVRLEYPLSERWRQSLRYRVERNEIENVQSNASRFIRDQEGQRDTSALSQRITYDSRDSTLFPTEGMLYWVDAEVAGLGGDAKYVSGKTGASYYYPITEKWILNILGEAGGITAYSDADVEINERFFLGGSNLRGFEKAGLGPRDTTTNDALGGNLFYRGTAEMSFPLGLPEDMGIKGHAFSDMGSLWSLDDSGPEVVDESSLRLSTGVGVSWRSPFGPVRVDLAKPLLEEDFDKDEMFRFNFGTRF